MVFISSPNFRHASLVFTSFCNQSHRSYDLSISGTPHWYSLICPTKATDLWCLFVWPIRATPQSCWVIMLLHTIDAMLCRPWLVSCSVCILWLKPCARTKLVAKDGVPVWFLVVYAYHSWNPFLWQTLSKQSVCIIDFLYRTLFMIPGSACDKLCNHTFNKLWSLAFPLSVSWMMHLHFSIVYPTGQFQRLCLCLTQANFRWYIDQRQLEKKQLHVNTGTAATLVECSITVLRLFRFFVCAAPAVARRLRKKLLCTKMVTVGKSLSIAALLYFIFPFRAAAAVRTIILVMLHA